MILPNYRQMWNPSPFWQFPRPETDGVWLFEVKDYSFLFLCYKLNYKPQMKGWLQKEDQFLNDDQYPKINCHPNANFMLKTSPHIIINIIFLSKELNEL